MNKETVGVAVLIISAMLFVGIIYSSMMGAIQVQGTGTVKVIGLEIYGDEARTIDLTVTGINWSIVEPGKRVSKDCWVYNPGNTPIILSMITSDWVPTNASDYIEVTWNYANQTIQPKTALVVTFDLLASLDIEGITDFSYLTTILGSG